MTNLERCARCGAAKSNMIHSEIAARTWKPELDAHAFVERVEGAEVKAESMSAGNHAQVDDIARQIVAVCKMWGYSQNFTSAMLVRARYMASHEKDWKNPLAGTGLKISPMGVAALTKDDLR